MKTKTASNVEQLSRAPFKSLHSILAAALLIIGADATTSRADIVYVSNLQTGAIVKITSSGGSSVFATAPEGAEGLAFDRSGNLYVASGNEILKYTPNGAESVFANNGLNVPTGLAFDAAGNLYAANSGNGTIEKFTIGGGGNLFASGLDDPAGLAFDSEGNLYVATTAGQTID